MRGVAAAGTALALSVLLVGCGASADGVAGQARAGDAKGYVAGDGSIQIVSTSKRRSPPSLTGTTLEGRTWSLRQERGRVVVLNVWGSWCGPCVAEAPELENAWAQFQARRVPVSFMGLDFKEGRAAGAAFSRKYNITYPSLEFDGGRPVLSLQGQAPAVPTTLIVDRQGRIAGRILGQTTAATVTGVVDQVLAEDPS